MIRISDRNGSMALPSYQLREDRLVCHSLTVRANRHDENLQPPQPLMREGINLLRQHRPPRSPKQQREWHFPSPDRRWFTRRRLNQLQRQWRVCPIVQLERTPQLIRESLVRQL